MRGAVVVALLAGCYAPSPPAGAPCADGVCPTGLVCSPATNTCEHSSVEIDAPLAVDAAPDDAPPDGPASPYLYRRRLTIKNNGNATLPTGFTIRVPVGLTVAMALSQSKIKLDLSDLRVIGDGTLGERDRIVDGVLGGPVPQQLSFSLAAPLGPNASTTAYALYYGRPTAGAAPANGSNVFAFYDDFTTALSPKWLVNDGPAVTGGKLVLHGGKLDAVTTTAATDGVPAISAVEVVASITNPQSDPTATPDGTFYYWFGYQHTGDFSASDPWIAWIARGKGSVGGEQKSPVGCEAGCEGPVGTQDTAAHYYLIERNPGETKFYRDGTLSYTAAVTNSADYSLMIRNFAATSDLQVDWFRARARVTPDPTITIAAEEAL